MRLRNWIFVLLIVGLVWLWSERERVQFYFNSSASAASTSLGALKSNKKNIVEIRSVGGVPSPLPFNDGQAESDVAKISAESVYCDIERAHIGIPLSGDVKIWTQGFEKDEDGHSGFLAFISSSECPEGLFSKVIMDDLGRVKDVVNCRTASKEEVLSSSGIQGNIGDRPSTSERLNLAVVGDGYFLMDCGGQKFLNRSGDFSVSGSSVYRGSCKLLSRDGSAFLWNGGEIDEEGCTAEGSCIAFVRADAGKVSYVDRITYRVHGDVLNDQPLMGRILNNSLEILDDPNSGPTGPQWELQPDFHIPKCSR